MPPFQRQLDGPLPASGPPLPPSMLQRCLHPISLLYERTLPRRMSECNFAPPPPPPPPPPPSPPRTLHIHRPERGRHPYDCPGTTLVPTHQPNLAQVHQPLSFGAADRMQQLIRKRGPSSCRRLTQPCLTLSSPPRLCIPATWCIVLQKFDTDAPKLIALNNLMGPELEAGAATRLPARLPACLSPAAPACLPAHPPACAR